MRPKWLVLVAALAAVAIYRTVLFVDETEFVIVTRFGQPVRTLRDAGLHLKLPYQSAIVIDRRLQIYDPRPSEFLTQEKKNVDLDAFVCWRVRDPQQFLKAVNDLPGAEPRLHDIVWSELAAEVGRRPLEALVSTDGDAHRLDSLVPEVAERCRKRAAQAYGIEIVDVQLKRIGLPSQVRESVFERMRSERQKMARQYRAEGEGKALEVRAAADKERTITLARAYAEAQKVRGSGEAEATRIYSQAHEKDAEFYEFFRTLEAYKKFLDSKTTIVLSADSDLLKYLTRGATPKAPPKQQ